MALPAENVLSTKDQQKRKHNGIYVPTNKCWVKGRKLRRLQTGKAKSRKYLKIYSPWITQKDRHLIRRKQMRVVTRQKQDIQIHRKEDSIGFMHTGRIDENYDPSIVPYNRKCSRRADFIDRVKSIDKQNDYEHGQSFCHASSKLRNISLNEYPTNSNISDARVYTYDTHSIDDPMVGDLNFRCNRFGSTLVWPLPDPQITTDLNLGNTRPFESLTFSESILSYEIPTFGHTRVIPSITLGHTNQISAYTLGQTRPL